MENIVPKIVLDEIKSHIRDRAEIGENGWEHSNEDEDTITGDFLGQLRTGWNKSKWNWKWRIIYKKFRGRGFGAYEKQIGADGIITVEIEDEVNNSKRLKSVIFQAKKECNENIPEQLKKMKETAQNGNMVIVYTDDGYYGIKGEEYQNSKNLENNAKRIGNYLGEDFIDCKIGLWEMDYDANKKELVFPTHRTTKINLLHRLKIEIKKEENDR